MIRRSLSLMFVSTCLCFADAAQQPFIINDADVAPRRHFHFEVSNEFDVLQRSSFLNLKQNAAEFELDYGRVSGQLLTINSDQNLQTFYTLGILQIVGFEDQGLRKRRNPVLRKRDNRCQGSKSKEQICLNV